MQRLFETILSYLTVLGGLAACSAASLDAGHTFSIVKPNNDETTMAIVEVRNGTRIADHQWVERLTSPSLSADVTVTRPALLVAIWWGDGGTGTTHTATPNNGFTIIDSVTADASLIQSIVATKSVTAGTYNVTWTSDSGEGAQLWLVAVDEPAGDGTPTLGGHTIAYHEHGTGGTTLTTSGITTDASSGAGSVILAAIAHFDIDTASTLPTSSEGILFSQVGTAHPYTDWPTSGTALYAAFPELPTPTPTPDSVLFDYDGDGKSDPSVFRASNGTWYVSRSGLGDMYVMPWGLAGDNIVPADYDGDGKTDLAVRRPADNNFYIFNSSNSTMEVRNFGIAGDIALPSDYNGDGKADVAVWRASNGTWYLSLSGSGIFYVMPWGLAADKPVPGDYDGDGKTDLAVFRPTEGRWYMFNTVTGAFSTNDFGMNGDTPVQADYSGDGKTDFAVYRASNNTWYRQHTNDGTFNVSQWGLAGDFPTPGDFDGDGRTDVAVWRPSDGTWYVLKSTSGVFTQSFGTSGDTPTPNAFVY